MGDACLIIADQAYTHQSAPQCDEPLASVSGAHGQASNVRCYQAKSRHNKLLLVDKRQPVRLELLRSHIAREVAVVCQGLLQRVEQALRQAQERPSLARGCVLNKEKSAAGPQHAPDLAQSSSGVGDGAQHLHGYRPLSNDQAKQAQQYAPRDSYHLLLDLK